jgi:hypothetical protein
MRRIVGRYSPSGSPLVISTIGASFRTGDRREGGDEPHRNAACRRGGPCVARGREARAFIR